MEEISHEIIQHCQNGSTADFSEIVEMYQRRVFAYLYRLDLRALGCEPEDLAQEVFLKAYQHIGGYNPARGAKFSTWLLTITRNHYLSLLRKRRNEVSASELGDGAAVDHPDLRQLSPSESTARKQMAQRIRDRVGQLPETLRSAFVLSYYEELPYAEIAKILDCKAETVKTRVFRAKQILCEQLREPDTPQRNGG